MKYIILENQNGKTYEGIYVLASSNQFDNNVTITTKTGYIVLDPKNGPVEIKRIKVK